VSAAGDAGDNQQQEEKVSAIRLHLATHGDNRCDRESTRVRPRQDMRLRCAITLS